MNLASEILDRLEQTYREAADPDRAPAMVAYMRNQVSFLGISAPRQKELTKVVLAGLPPPAEADVVAVVQACWALTEREFRYFGCGYARRHIKRCGPTFLPTLEAAISTDSWWDTVDALASHGVGPLVRAHPPLLTEMDRWIDSSDLWLARSAIIYQLGAKAATDTARLFDYCERRAGDTDFFIRKAIGWALREYAKTDPAAVRRFVSDHDAELSGLSKREALKHLS